MADYCTHCAKEMWGNELPPEIDVQSLFDQLESGTAINVLCEGCGMKMIGNIKGELKVMYDENPKCENKEWLDYKPNKLFIGDE